MRYALKLAWFVFVAVTVGPTLTPLFRPALAIAWSRIKPPEGTTGA
jgi:hypothetical protein